MRCPKFSSSALPAVMYDLYVLQKIKANPEWKSFLCSVIAAIPLIILQNDILGNEDHLLRCFSQLMLRLWSHIYFPYLGYILVLCTIIESWVHHFMEVVKAMPVRIMMKSGWTKCRLAIWIDSGIMLEAILLVNLHRSATPNPINLSLE